MMNRPVYIIAEMAYAHDGSPKLAAEILQQASRAGADAISVHITHMPAYMVPTYGNAPGRSSCSERPLYPYLQDISLSFEHWRAVVSQARQLGLDVIIMPNDLPSLDFTATLEFQALTLTPAAFEDFDFIRRLGEFRKPVYLRVGGSTLGEMEAVIECLYRTGNEEITLLYGHQNYPTALADNHLNSISTLQQTFGLPVGLADHIDAEDEFALIAPLIAIPLGVTCIEKHLTHDRGLKGEDHESALNGDELALLVQRVRRTEQLLGKRHLRSLDTSSLAYRETVRKRLVTSRPISAGETLTADMLACKRADEGLPPSWRSQLIGLRVKRDLPENAGVTLESLGLKQS